MGRVFDFFLPVLGVLPSVFAFAASGDTEHLDTCACSASVTHLGCSHHISRVLRPRSNSSFAFSCKLYGLGHVSNNTNAIAGAVAAIS